MTSAPPRFDSVSFQKRLRQRNLEQLRNIPLPPAGTPSPSPPPKESGTGSFDDLVEWSKQAASQIQIAISKQAISPANMDWNIGIFTLLESATTYLRDTQKVREAQVEAHKNTPAGDERALELLLDAQSDIKKIAELWGLEFEVICDLIKWSPHGSIFLDGPYCGVFYSTDSTEPFFGLAFKGTNPTNINEIITDIEAVLTLAANNELWGSPIHQGFYETMFGKYSAPGFADETAFTYIKDTVDKFLQQWYTTSPDLSIPMHVTGHSLGAAYALLCFAEIMRRWNDTPTVPNPIEGTDGDLWMSLWKERKFVLGDLYTFGCPRSGGAEDEKDWALSFQTALDNHTGHSWRIVNQDDPVTHVPPVFPWIHKKWNHVNNGINIFPDSGPQPLASEIGTDPGVTVNPLKATNHYTSSYFQSLYYTVTH